MVQTLSLFAIALLFGGMVFFAAVMAPLVFTKLPGDVAGRFIRQVFPFYYLYVLAISAVGGIALLPLRSPDAVALMAVALVTVWLRQVLMVRINRLSDAARGGDTAAKPRFDRAHRLSVVINLAQVGVVGAVLARFVAP
jgi:hypothetical protein